MIFVGFAMGSKRVKEELTSQGTFKGELIPLLMFLVRFIAPIGIALVFLNIIGLLNFG